MQKLLKKIIISGILLIPMLSFAQETRFIEITVSDTVTLKSIGYTYQVDIGSQVEFMGMKIPQDDKRDKPKTSITEVTNTIKKGNFKYTLSTDQDYSISGSSSQPSIFIDVINENELKSLVNLLKQQEGITGKIKEAKYESDSKYQSQIFKNLYAKALAQATLMATISGNSVGQLLSVSEAKSITDAYLDIYKQMLKIMPVGMIGDGNVNEKKEVINMIFKFELK